MIHLPDRFWGNIDQSAGPDGCWPWVASRRRDGYGQFQIDGVRYGSHRLAWMSANGEIPDGQHILHRCDNPACCNPAHLFAGDHRINMLDMTAKGRNVSAIKTHCPRGHEYDEQNTYVHQGKRHCRACNKEASRAYHVRRRLSVGGE